MTHAYSNGQNVMYNSQFSTICMLRIVNSEPAYLVREINSGTSHDNVLETALSPCEITAIINDKWATFNYTGDNGASSAWIMNNIIKHIGSGSGLSWGPNEDNTVYSLTVSGQTWTKNKA